MKILLKITLTIAIVTLIGFAALATSARTAYANYNEECLNEGCDNEEVFELYNSYTTECLQERCYYEEVHELAGGSAVAPSKVLDSNQLHYRMFYDFDSRFNGFDYPCYDGYTTPPWNRPEAHLEYCWGY